jgi:hypothetical protein
MARLSAFNTAISMARTPDAIWAALGDMAQAAAGHRLFTVTSVDMNAGLARRLYTSHPKEYPVSGTKPIHRDAWFDIVHGERRSFVANTIADIAKVFPDHELIRSLGCGSVINLPVVLRGELVATVNLLHEEHHYTPGRVEAAERELKTPAMLCCALC